MANADQMLRYIHKYDPASASKRYNPKQLQKAYEALYVKRGGTIAPAPVAADPNQIQTDPNQLDTGDFTDERSRIEDSLYNNLTKNTQRDYDLEKQNMEQTLLNRGIALDPTNPAYQHELQSLNDHYDSIKESARNDATVLGGQEFDRYFGADMKQKEFGLSQEELALKRKQINAAIKAMNQRRGGGTVDPNANSAFNSSAPPGL